MPDQVTIKFGVDGVSQAIAQIKELGASVVDMAKEFAAPVVALASVSGIVELANSFQDFNIQVGKASEITGIATSDMAGLALAAQRSDIPFETLNQSLKAFGKWLTDSGQGSRDMTEALMEQADFFQSFDDGAVKIAVAQERFGKSGIEMIPFLNKGAAAIRELVAQQMDLSGVTAESVAKARDLHDSFIDLKTASEGLWGTLSQQLGLSDFFKNLAGGEVMIRKLVSGTNDVATAVAKIDPKKLAGLWTGEQLEAANKAIDQQRESLELEKQIRDVMTKGIGSYSQGTQSDPFHADQAALDKEAELTRQKLANANEVHGHGGMADVQLQQVRLETDKELLAIDQNRQAIQQRDIADAMKQEELAQKEFERKRAMLQNDYTKTAEEKRLGDIMLLRQESDHLQTLIDAMKATKLQDEKDPNRAAMAPALQVGIENADQQKQKTDQQLALKQGQPDPTSFKDAWSKTLTQIKQESAATWQSITDVMHHTLGTAVDSLSENFTKLVLGTETWRQLLVSVGSAIESQILGSIIKMAAQALIEWMPAAIMSSIASDGESAGSGLAAVLSALTGFSAGGYTGPGGMYDVAGVVHRGEYVMPANTVQRLGLPYMESIRNSGAGASSSAVSVGGVALHIGDNEDETRRKILSHPEFEHHVINVARKNSHRIIPRQA